MTLHIYLPQDRLRALANNTTLAGRTSGAALFADISGFTALTESLRETLGARKGAEELSTQLGAVYSALIAEVEKYGGSVIGFAGDAMMCWFDLSPQPPSLEGKGVTPQASGVRSAVTCAFAMQIAIQSFPALALKVSVANGSARRFVVGDESIQRLDTLAGATVARTAVGEHLATKGEVLVDEATASLLGDSLAIKEWRVDEGGERFAVVKELSVRSEQLSMPPLITDSLVTDASVLRPFIHHAVYERETSGQGSFLTEFRPCVALFVRFTGIGYDADSAEDELHEFICSVQATADRYEGTLMDITIGDKGSYAYINFGALSAHEDDARRAVKTALELLHKTELQLQMGITQGIMRVGAYGGATRKAFGALGDDVNLAARLMTTASPGEILISSHVHKAVMNWFTFEPRPPLLVKGKAEPVPLFAVTGESKRRAIRLQEPGYSLPMVGRTQELQVINDELDLAAKGQAQVIGIVAEAGMGKSRLVAEVIRSARRKGFAGYGGACQSDGVNTPYLAWKSIWSAFFDVDPSVALKKQIRDLESEIEAQAPDRRQATPVLSIVLDLELPENDFTRALEPEHRKNVLTSLLQDCLAAAARSEPILIVIEDLHWIDALSHDLLEALAKELADCRICFVLAYRPPQLMRLQAPRLEALPHFTKIKLDELNTAEGEQAIRAKLAQLYPSRSDAVPPLLVEKLMLRSQGNPFYLEELLNYLRDRGLDPRASSDLEKIELPDSLYTLVLSRIDQLSEREKTTLRAASVVGRLFRAAWLAGYYPALGGLAHVKVDLDKLDSLDITPLDSEPELAYLFKHIVTHEVTYESLPFATRAQLHEQLGRYLEGIAAPVELIAQHYGRGNNQAKQREYFEKAGDAARAAFANEAALEYYARLYPLLSEPKERGSLHFKRAEAYFGWGRLAEARANVILGLDFIGPPLPKSAWQWQIRLMGEMMQQTRNRLRFADRPAQDEPGLETSRINAEELDLTRAYELLVFIDAMASQASLADVYYLLRMLNIAESWRHKSPALARAYAMMGTGVAAVPMHKLARNYLHQARVTMEGLDHLPTLASVLYHTGFYAIGVGDWEECERAFLQALEIFDRLGDRRNWALTLVSLGMLAYFRGQFELSIQRFTDVYKQGQTSSHIEHQVWGLNGQSLNLVRLGQTTQAGATQAGVLPLFDSITGSSLTELLVQAVLAIIHLRQGQLEPARQYADATERLLAQASISAYSAFEGYVSVAEVYLKLWEMEKSQFPGGKSQMKRSAEKACRALHRYARIYPIGLSRAWLWQGLYDWLAGKPRRARRAWQKSLAAAQKSEMPYDEALAFYEIGRHASGDERESNLRRANDIFEQLGVDQHAFIHQG